MTDQTKTALTADIKKNWILRFENWYIHFMKRRGNKTGFFITVFLLMVSLAFSLIALFPFLGFGFFLCYTSIAGGFKERAWAKKYNLPLPEVLGLIGEIYP